MIDIAVNAATPEIRAAWWPASVEAGVTGWLLLGTTLAESKALASAQLLPGQKYTAGVHPHYGAERIEWAEFEPLWQDPACVAVGECGLDFFRMLTPEALQIEVFDRHIDAATRFAKPLYIHDRDAFETLAPRIEALKIPRVVHCFTGTRQALERYLEAGCYIGLTAWFLDERRGQALRDMLPSIQLDRLMLETDAPYLAPRTMRPRPKQNEPAFLAHTVEHLAEDLRLSLDELIALTRANTERVFGEFGAQ